MPRRCFHSVIILSVFQLFYLGLCLGFLLFVLFCFVDNLVDLKITLLFVVWITLSVLHFVSFILPIFSLLLAWNHFNSILLIVQKPGVGLFISYTSCWHTMLTLFWIQVFVGTIKYSPQLERQRKKQKILILGFSSPPNKFFLKKSLFWIKNIFSQIHVNILTLTSRKHLSKSLILKLRFEITST